MNRINILCSLCGRSLESWELGHPRTAYHFRAGVNSDFCVALQFIITNPAGASGTPHMCDDCAVSVRRLLEAVVRDVQALKQ